MGLVAFIACEFTGLSCEGTGIRVLRVVGSDPIGESLQAREGCVGLYDSQRTWGNFLW